MARTPALPPRPPELVTEALEKRIEKLEQTLQLALERLRALESKRREP